MEEPKSYSIEKLNESNYRSWSQVHHEDRIFHIGYIEKPIFANTQKAIFVMLSSLISMIKICGR
jgi:hypothetical protein